MARFITEWVTTQFARFLARHHWHNANQKRAILIKRAKICYVKTNLYNKNISIFDPN